jgi:PAS domain S-box-containing protein
LKSALIIALLAALAAWINQCAPTVFFDMQLMFGGSIAVFALLQFGWAGLLVGITALGVTALRWGHPFELMIGTLFLVWSKVFLDRFNGGREHQDNGRIVLAAIAFWLTAGIGLEVAMFHLRFGVEVLQALVLALKEAAIGMINVTLGLFIYIIAGALGLRKIDTTVPVRGAVSVIVLLAITVPAISLSLISTRQLQVAMIEAYRLELYQKAYALIQVNPDHAGKPDDAQLDFVIQQPGGAAASSNPGLIDRLNQDYTKFETNRSGVSGLDFYAPNTSMPVLEEDLLSYWGVTFVHQEKGADRSPQIITVLQPANVLFERLDRGLLLPVFSLLFGLFVAGGLAGELLGTLVHRQFQRVLSPGDQEALGPSRIRELHQLSREINTRERQVHELNDVLAKTRQTAYDLTENIPIGTYTMVQPPDGGVAYFSFMSSRFLELTGLTFEEARSDPMKAFECVHPDDRDEWVRKNIEVFEKKLPFCEECRVVVNGETRWIIAESRPRELPDGSVVWEGVLSDITNEKMAAERERELEAAHRKNLESKLKSSLAAAAIGHEINTPLSTLLLQSKQSLKQGFATREELSLMAVEAEHVLRIIEKMKVLMRNVQTEHAPVNLRDVVDSALLQVKRTLIKHDIDVMLRESDSSPFMVAGDDAQIQLALTNILRNAMEAITGDGVERPHEILIELGRQTDGIRITIGDSGPGWSGAQLEELPLNTTKEGGTGIGLYIIRTTAQNHRARLDFSPSPLGGAEVSITFPVTPGHQARS